MKGSRVLDDGHSRWKMKGLEFRESLADSPWHRANLREHEAALDAACKAIKRLESQCQELVAAAHKLGTVQRAFAESLSQFSLFTTHRHHFQTDDERVIDNCVKEFANLINQVEDQRDRILHEAEVAYIEPLHKFRTERIGRVLQEDRKSFEKKSRHYYSLLDKHLGLTEKSAAKADAAGASAHSGLRDADAELELSQRQHFAASLDYVNALQSVEERMSFEFIDTLSGFLYSFLSFYHVGYRIHEDFKPALDSVVRKVHQAKESYAATQSEAEELKARMLNSAAEIVNDPKSTFKQGYLYLMEKKRTNLGGIGWSPYFCVFQRESGTFTMLPFSSSDRKSAKEINVSRSFAQSRAFKLKLCRRRASATIERRFCFDVTEDRDSEVYTFQALSEDDLRSWLHAMDGQEPVYSGGSGGGRGGSDVRATELDEAGLAFVGKCLAAVEERGLDEQGLYRNCGVTSKVSKLLATTRDKKKVDALNLADAKEYDIRTVTSAVKAFLRNLGEPLMTWELHAEFINAAKVPDMRGRVAQVHHHVHRLPRTNRRLLRAVAEHLSRVAAHSATNLMPVPNLGVCFGPSLLRPRDETLAAIMDIKFANVVVEVLIQHADTIFHSKPPVAAAVPPKPGHQPPAPVPPAHRTPPPPPNEPSSSNAQADIGEAGASPDVGGSEWRERRRQPVLASSGDLSSTDSLHSASPSPSRNHTRMSTSYATPYPGDTSQKRMSRGSLLSNSCRRVRTLYLCEAGHVSELSFQPNQIITNVRDSKEPGWLLGTLNGKSGLIPANYVESLP